MHQESLQSIGRTNISLCLSLSPTHTLSLFLSLSHTLAHMILPEKEEEVQGGVYLIKWRECISDQVY